MSAAAFFEEVGFELGLSISRGLKRGLVEVVRVPRRQRSPVVREVRAARADVPTAPFSMAAEVAAAKKAPTPPKPLTTPSATTSAGPSSPAASEVPVTSERKTRRRFATDDGHGDSFADSFAREVKRDAAAVNAAAQTRQQQGHPTGTKRDVVKRLDGGQEELECGHVIRPAPGPKADARFCPLCPRAVRGSLGGAIEKARGGA